MVTGKFLIQRLDRINWFSLIFENNDVLSHITDFVLTQYFYHNSSLHHGGGLEHVPDKIISSRTWDQKN